MAEEEEKSRAQSRVASVTSSRRHSDESLEPTSKSSALVGIQVKDT